MNMAIAPQQIMAPTTPSKPPEALSQAAPFPAAADTESMWRQVLARDHTATFLYAVRTTGIFCRPSCPSRRPAPCNVIFFPSTEAASKAGFRTCLRCQPDQQPADAALVERLVNYLECRLDRQVSLDELARVAERAPGTVQRVFTRLTGLSPRSWANARRAEAYRSLLTGSASEAKATITNAVYAAGFSGPSRAHSATELGMQAKRYRAQGAGEQIGYTLADAPLPSSSGHRGGLGRILVAATARGVCAILLGDEDAGLTAELARRFPRALLAADPALAPRLAAVLAELGEHPSAQALSLDLRGTAFQARVWSALRAIPRGETRSYAQLATAIGAPRAVRAVAAACGQNPAAIVVPCHRVIGSNGKLTGYRWGLDRKRALLAVEAGAARPSDKSIDTDQTGD